MASTKWSLLEVPLREDRRHKDIFVVVEGDTEALLPTFELSTLNNTAEEKRKAATSLAAILNTVRRIADNNGPFMCASGTCGRCDICELRRSIELLGRKD